jgi:hypothetical protein
MAFMPRLLNLAVNSSSKILLITWFLDPPITRMLLSLSPWYWGSFQTAFKFVKEHEAAINRQKAVVALIKFLVFSFESPTIAFLSV